MEKKYRIVGEPGNYQIVEQFGSYRISKKRFKTPQKALERIKALDGECKNPEILA